jgi:hypothetical protein
MPKYICEKDRTVNGIGNQTEIEVQNTFFSGIIFGVKILIQ